jgi:tyrosine-protein kinase Etk/Wzc
MALSENAELEELIRRATSDSTGQLPPLIGTNLATADDQDDLGGGLDISTLILVARRSLVWVLLLLALGFTASWLFLRYTKPIYKSASVLKLDERSEAANLGLGAIKGDESRIGSQLPGEIELIKSNLTYQHLKQRLELDINYYVKGTVLEAELYDKAPFHIQYKVSDSELYGRKFQVSFPTLTTYQVSVKAHDQTLTGTYPIGQWATLPGVQLLLNLVPSRPLPTGEAEYHFVILSDGAISGYLDRNLDVAIVNPNANTIQISFTDNNPEKAAHIVNNIDTVYLQEKLARKKQSTDLTVGYLDQVIADNDRKLREAEERQKDFVRQNKTYDVKAEIGDLKTRLEQQQEQREKVQQKLRVLADVSRIMERDQLTRDDETVADNLPGLAELEDPVLVGILNQLDGEQRSLRLTLKSQTDKTFAVQRNQSIVRETRASLRNQLQQAQVLLQKQLTRLDQLDSKLSARLLAMPEKATELERLQRPLSLYTAAYQRLVDRKMDFSIQQAGTTADFQILSPASPPGEPISPVRLLVYAVGLAGGLVLGLGLIATRYFMHNTITGIGELERGARAAVLGVIPTYDKEKLEVSRLVVDRNPKSSVSEAIRSIRTNLDFISPATKKRIISVTSTISGEGKTFVAVNLGGIIAQSGQRVIILDLDMRKPKVNLAFDADNVRGISTILIERHTLTECIQHTNIEALDFISAGPTPPNPSELILNPRFDQMLVELHRSYDVILIDTPPVGLVTDGILIMRKADVPIYIVRAN